MTHGRSGCAIRPGGPLTSLFAHKEAVAAGLEAHSRGHQSPDVHLLLAKIYEAQGNHPAELTELLNYLDENPNSAAADQVRRQLEALQKQ